MKIAKTRVVFDRQHKATKKVSATVYIEVLYKRERNFYNTGVRLFSDQFRNGKVVKLKSKSEFSLEALKRFMDSRNADAVNSFLRFMLQKIMERPVAESTRKGHISVYNTLKKWGRITQFSDINEENIMLWDELARKNAVKS